MAFKAIWNCPAPSKVGGFSWMVLHNRIPTRDNLFRRRVFRMKGSRIVLCLGMKQKLQFICLFTVILRFRFGTKCLVGLDWNSLYLIIWYL
ncbi:hypothetical protein L195_g061640 [Trifolium pratense]|uniref:Reverse transcriptase zinc-binding domain-containing protein n=1 Tax=Trifolium pratense TaxID=57577 RepID=A0A2K3KAY9_TRIPR|nr:hypothetical protein L195_g061640 [Trifolium pratense]